MAGLKRVSWRETTGMIDAIVELHEPSSTFQWLDRNGCRKSGREFIFAVGATNLDVIHEHIIIREEEIGVQRYHYDSETGRFNEITYHPAYRFTHAAGGLAITGIVIARDGTLTVPVAGGFRDILRPTGVIEDLRYIMCVPEGVHHPLGT